ncbi:MAG: GNAT family N-acetyltransferase [Candidatus Acidiferrales bacterium]
MASASQSGDTEVRIAMANDNEAIAEIVNRAYVVEEFFLAGKRTDPDRIRALMEKGKFLLREDGGRLVGSVYVEIRGDRGYFGLLAVEPEMQGRGLGRFLVEAAEDYARKNGCSAMDLTIVNLRTELPPFYGRLGYVEDGTEPFHADAKVRLPCHFIKMTKSLA